MKRTLIAFISLALLCASLQATALPVIAVLPPSDEAGEYSWGPGIAAAITDALSSSPDYIVLSDQQVLSALDRFAVGAAPAPERAATLLRADIVISGELTRLPNLQLVLAVQGAQADISPVEAAGCAELLRKACAQLVGTFSVSGLQQSHLTDSEEAAQAFMEARYYHCRYEAADTALESYQQALAAAPEFALARYQRANLLRDVGRWEEAREEYEAALRLGEHWPRAQANLASVYFMLGDTGRADSLWQQVAGQGLDPLAVAYATNNLGTALLARKDLPGAERQYRMALGLWPDYAMATANLGLLERVRKDYRAAVGYLQGAASQESDLKAAAFAEKTWGDLLRQQKKYSEALEHYRRALDIQPWHAMAYVNMGVTYKQMGRTSEAEYSYREAINLGNNPIAAAYAHNNLGNLFMAKYMYRVAAGEYERALELKPDYEAARDNLAKARQRIRGQ